MIDPNVPVEQTLALSCAVIHALIDELGPAPEPDERERRRREATRAIKTFPLPAAVFGGIRSGRPLRNAAWRTAFRGVVEAPPDARAAVETVRRTRTGLHLAEIAVPLATHTGYFAITLEPLRGPSSAPAGVIAVCADITDHVLARQLDVDPCDPIWGGATGAPTYYNRAWHTSIGGSWHEAIHEADAERAFTALAEARRRGLATPVDVRLRNHAGQTRWHRVRYVARGEAAWIAHAVDVDTAHRLERERDELLDAARIARAAAEAANRLKDEVLSAVSHELRGQVTTLLVWERALRDAGGDDAARRRAIEAIHESAVAQSRLVADLLDVARGADGKLYLDIRIVDVDALVTDATTAAAAPARARGVELTYTAEPRAGAIHGDATRLRQVLDNLLAYAIERTPAGGAVAAATCRRGRSIVITIEHTGRGIPAADLARLFEPFAHRPDGRLGLGLAIAKQIVELHRGTLTATCEGEDRGLGFTLTLPIAGTSRAPSPPVGARRARSLDGARVLVVDDDPRVLEALAQLLEGAGARVDTASNATAARARIAATPPDAVICDLAMTGEDGYTFLHGLRAAGLATPAIALTGHVGDRDVQHAIAAGFDRHLAKPISSETLVASLSELLAARPRR